MSDTTKIEWATATWNPWEGCTMISPGCANCYAAARNHRFGMDNWGKGKPRRRTSAANWKKPLAWDKVEGKHQSFMEGTGERPRIFPSLCDWLDDEVPIELLSDFLRVIHDTPNLDWLLLTKRPENWASRIEGVLRWIEEDSARGAPMAHRHDVLRNWLGYWLVLCKPPATVWLGTSVEDRPRKSRIEELRKTPANVRFLSLEPLLEDVGELDLRGIHWVIVGGESGPGARPCNVDWVRSIVGQCKAAGVPCFAKQLGSKPYNRHPKHIGATHSQLCLNHPKGGDPSEWPADLRVREFPKV